MRTTLICLESCHLVTFQTTRAAESTVATAISDVGGLGERLASCTRTFPVKEAVAINYGRAIVDCIGNIRIQHPSQKRNSPVYEICFSYTWTPTTNPSIRTVLHGTRPNQKKSPPEGGIESVTCLGILGFAYL
jgi:hypothetical protein